MTDNKLNEAYERWKEDKGLRNESKLFFLVVKDGNEELFRLLSPLAIDKERMASYLALSGKKEWLNFMIDNLGVHDWNNMASAAARKGRMDIVDDLIKYGADAWHWIVSSLVQGGHNEILVELIQDTLQTVPYDRQELVDYAKEGVKMLKYIKRACRYSRSYGIIHTLLQKAKQWLSEYVNQDIKNREFIFDSKSKWESIIRFAKTADEEDINDFIDLINEEIVKLYSMWIK